MAEDVFDRDSRRKIGKQIVLPMRKAIEISLKSLKIRFWRSMITVGSIILAIAFLSHILISSSIARSLKDGSDRSLAAREAEMKAMKATIGVGVSEELIMLNRNFRKMNARIEALKKEISELEKQGEDEAESGKAQEEEPEDGGPQKALRDQLPGLERRLRDLREQLKAAEDGIGADASRDLMELNVLLIEERNSHDALEIVLAIGGGEDEDAAKQVGETSGGFFSGFKAKDYWLTSIALVVCFVGIVNAMLMSVTERFREIGTMKCLGALDSFIVKLFVLESMFQGALGTFIGIIIGVLLSIVMAWWSYGSNTFRFFPLAGVLACMLVSQAIGTLLTIVAAVFPARAAARMQPVDALRADQ